MPVPCDTVRATKSHRFAQRNTYASRNDAVTLRATTRLCFVQRHGDGATFEKPQRDARGLHSYVSKRLSHMGQMLCRVRLSLLQSRYGSMPVIVSVKGHHFFNTFFPFCITMPRIV